MRVFGVGDGLTLTRRTFGAIDACSVRGRAPGARSEFGGPMTTRGDSRTRLQLDAAVTVLVDPDKAASGNAGTDDAGSDNAVAAA